MSDTINTKMTALANAIRDKSGRTDKLTLDEMTTAVQGIEVGIDTSDATAVAADIMEGQTAYANGSKLTGTFTLDNESSAQDTLITNIKTALAGKASVVPVLQNKTVTPSTSQQVVSADSGYDGLKRVTVEGDADLISANILSGKNIFGVTGSAANTSDATAVAADILKNKTAYINGKKVTGTIESQAAKTITPSTAVQTAIAKGYYASGNITVAGDNNLKAENIKSGTSIFGVEGTYEGAGGSGGSPILFGTYMFDRYVVLNSSNLTETLEVNLENQYAYVYNWDLLEDIKKIEISSDGLKIIYVDDDSGAEFPQILQDGFSLNSQNGWLNANNNPVRNDSLYSFIISFNQPITVSQTFYDLFINLMEKQTENSPYLNGYQLGYESGQSDVMVSSAIVTVVNESQTEAYIFYQDSSLQPVVIDCSSSLTFFECVEMSVIYLSDSCTISSYSEDGFLPLSQFAPLIGGGAFNHSDGKAFIVGMGGEIHLE